MAQALGWGAPLVLGFIALWFADLRKRKLEFRELFTSV